jgi:hypothetical protein
MDCQRYRSRRFDAPIAGERDAGNSTPIRVRLANGYALRFSLHGVAGRRSDATRRSPSKPRRSVRLVTRQDYDQWLPLWDGYNAFYGQVGATALSPEIKRMTWARFFDAYEPVHGLVAESGGRLLSLTHYLFHRSTTAIEPVCYLQDPASAAFRACG